MSLRKNRVFLDSDVILSGLFSDRGAPRIILDVLTLGLPALTGLTGEFNLLGIERNIARTLPGARPLWREHVPKLRLEVIPLPSSWDLALLGESVEKKNLPVLASAIKGKADHFVSGDERLLARLAERSDLPFRVFAPGEFSGRILPDILSRRP